jgi:hypothetical protein
MNKLLPFVFFMLIHVMDSAAQMPPPGYERAIKIQQEREKLAPMDRDSVTLIDTIQVFDPDTYESETRIVSSRVSVRDYCIRLLGMANPDILLDRNPHTIIDPRTYDELTIRLNERGKLDTIPK